MKHKNHMTRKELSITLSRLKLFDKPSVNLEQYPTDSEIAGNALWFAYMQGDIKDKTVADLGSGTGILGLGALLLGAKKAWLADKDPDAISLAMENKELLEKEFDKTLNASFLTGDINMFDHKADTVVMNPPFGTRNEKADTLFLYKAMSISDTIYSFHKATTKPYIDRLVQDNGFRITHYQEYDFPLKQTMPGHKKKIERIKVGLWRFQRNK